LRFFEIKMSKPHYQQLAKSLEKARNLSKDGFVKGTDLDRTTKAQLIASGYLTNVIRGWYLLSRPDVTGSSTAWYASFWDFLDHYLTDRFTRTGYCLSAETSIDIYTGETTIAKQVVVLTRKPSNQAIRLLYDTSLFLYYDKNFPEIIERKNALNLMPMAQAITCLNTNYFRIKQQNAEIALKTVSETDLSRALLQASSLTAAARTIGSLNAIGENKKATKIEGDLKAAGIIFQPENPFDRPPILGNIMVNSPYAGRIEALWKSLRDEVIANFPPPNRETTSIEIIEKIYNQDAYHSLSIEGYEVTADLIQKIGSGNWNPEQDLNDKHQADAMAAKGYFEVFKAVITCITKIRGGDKPGAVFEDELQSWYLALFSPSVQTGLIPATSLAGYRNGPVYIKGSRHVPPPKDAIPDAMNKLFELMKNEPEASVRAVLGHYIFGYIHPYIDGNGRIARFIMNLMLVTGGFNWTVIRVEKRAEYMDALETCGRDNTIAKFTKLIVSEMKYWKKRGPTVTGQ
jgi:Fic/DOC family